MNLTRGYVRHNATGSTRFGEIEWEWRKRSGTCRQLKTLVQTWRKCMMRCGRPSPWARQCFLGPPRAQTSRCKDTRADGKRRTAFIRQTRRCEAAIKLSMRPSSARTWQTGCRSGRQHAPPPRRRQSGQRRGDRRLAQEHRPPRLRRSDQGVWPRLVPGARRCVKGADHGDDARP